MKIITALLVSLCVWVFPLVHIKALAPPDIIYNVMQQLPQIIAMVFGFFSMISFGIYNYLKIIGKVFKFKKWQWLLIVAALLLLSAGIGYAITYFVQQQALNTMNGG